MSKMFGSIAMPESENAEEEFERKEQEKREKRRLNFIKLEKQALQKEREKIKAEREALTKERINVMNEAKKIQIQKSMVLKMRKSLDRKQVEVRRIHNERVKQQQRIFREQRHLENLRRRLRLKETQLKSLSESHKSENEKLHQFREEIQKDIERMEIEEKKKRSLVMRIVDGEYQEMIRDLDQNRETFQKIRAKNQSEFKHRRVYKDGPPFYQLKFKNFGTDPFSPSVNEETFSEMIHKDDFNSSYLIKTDQHGTIDLLIYASFYGFSGEIEYLLGICDPTRNDFQCLQFAVENEHEGVIFQLVHDARVKPTREILQSAIKSDSLESVKLLCLFETLRPKVEDVMMCIELGFTDLVEFFCFIDRRVFPFSRKHSLIKMAVSLGKNDIVRLILKHPDVDPCVEKNVMFKEACRQCNEEMIEILYLSHKFKTSRKNAMKMAMSEISSGDIQKKQQLRGVINRLSSENRKRKQKVNDNCRNMKQLAGEYHHISLTVVYYIFTEVCQYNMEIAKETLESLNPDQVSQILNSQKDLVDEEFIRKELENNSFEEEEEEEEEEEGEEEGEEEDDEEEENEGKKVMSKEMQQTLENIEANITCPISFEIFQDPVILVESAQTYERSAIETWLKNHSTCPLTRIRLRSKTLVTNIILRNQVEEWKKLTENNDEESNL